MLKIISKKRYEKLVWERDFEVSNNESISSENETLKQTNSSLKKLVSKLKYNLSEKTDLVNLLIEENKKLGIAKNRFETLLKDSVDSRAELDEWRKRALFEEQENERLHEILNGYKLLVSQIDISKLTNTELEKLMDVENVSAMSALITRETKSKPNKK